MPRAIGLESAAGGGISNNACFNPTYRHGALESEFIAMLGGVTGVVVSGNQVSGCDHAVHALSQRGNLGNAVLANAVTGDDAPCRVDLPNDRNDEPGAGPVGDGARVRSARSWLNDRAP